MCIAPTARSRSPHGPQTVASAPGRPKPRPSSESAPQGRIRAARPISGRDPRTPRRPRSRPENSRARSRALRVEIRQVQRERIRLDGPSACQRRHRGRGRGYRGAHARSARRARISRSVDPRKSKMRALESDPEKRVLVVQLEYCPRTTARICTNQSHGNCNENHVSSSSGSSALSCPHLGHTQSISS